MVKLSIVVIIYKIEDYLRQCIDSILKQSYKDFELILVDDGSPDRCPEICDEYAAMDKRIRVIHQKNQGSLAARWAGLKASSGMYVSLLDGDDWVDEDAFQCMMELAEKHDADIVVAGYKECRSNGNILKRNAMDSGVYQGSSIQQVFKTALYNDNFYVPGIIPALWNKLFRRELFFHDYNAPDRIIRMGEDASISYPMIARSNTIVLDNDIHPFNYRIVEGSMSRSYDEKYFERAKHLLSSLKANLAFNSDMLNGLNYYALFILGMGAKRVLARDAHISLKKKTDILREIAEYIRETVNTREIDWIGFDKYERSFYSLLLKGNVTALMALQYSHRIKERIMGRAPERIYNAFKEIKSKRC